MQKKIFEAERRNLEAHILIGTIDNLLKRPEVISGSFYVQPNDTVAALDATDSTQGLHRGKIDPARQSTHLDDLRELERAQQLVKSARGDELPFVQDSQTVAQSFRLFHVMRGVQDGVAFI